MQLDSWRVRLVLFVTLFRYIAIYKSIIFSMHSVLQRANAISAYALSVLACLTFACFLSTVFLDYRTNADISTVNVVVWVIKTRIFFKLYLFLLCYRKNVPDYSASREKNDLGFVTFDLHTDLSHLFNWNVKQLFLYLTAEYETPNNSLNQVLLNITCIFQC